MKNKIITLILSISCMILIACNTESVEPVATVESTEYIETVTEVVEGYSAEEETEETEVLTGAEIDIDNIEYEDISLPEEVSQITRGISNYAGTTSKHGYKYPADYVENSGNSVADTERMFDEGFFSEEEYQEMIEFARELDSGSLDKQIQDEINSFNNNSGGTTGGGAPIELPVLPETVPDGRICY